MVSSSRAAVRTDRLRPLNVPRPAVVTTDELTTVADAREETHAGLPTTVEFDGKRRVVEDIIEVWRVDDEWWRDYICRRYMDVALESGGHVILFQDLVTGDWYVQDP